MNFTINGKMLTEALEKINKNITPRVEDEIFKSLELKVTTSGLSLIAVTSDTITRTEVTDIAIGQTGSVILNFNKFLAIVKENKDYELTIQTGQNNILSIGFDESVMKLPTLDSKDSVTVVHNQAELQSVLTLTWNNFKLLATNAAISASKKESRPILKTAQWKTVNDHLSIVATDSHRLYRADFSVVTPNFEVLINAVELKKFSKIKNQQSVEIFYDSGNNGLLLQGNDTQMFIRGVKENYPETSHLIQPTLDAQTAFTIKKNDFEKANKRGAMVVKNDFGAAVKLNVENGTVVLSAFSKSDKSSIESNLDIIQSTGENITISYNAAYVLDAIKQIKENEITIYLFAPLSPFIIQGRDNSSVTTLVTPVRTF